MGADGHIAIYDWSKTMEQFPELREDEDLYHLVKGDAYIYPNPVGEGKWLVAYWGDNLFMPTFPGYEADWQPRGSEAQLKQAKEIVQWMEENAVIVSNWEVWT